METADKRLRETLAICDALVDLDQQQRTCRLLALTEDDLQLRRGVEALLRAIDSSCGFLEPGSTNRVLLADLDDTFQWQDCRVSRSKSGKS
ncbi:MAG: hypothetical protein AAGH76_07670 [Pseudomonadota bacterium]